MRMQHLRYNAVLKQLLLLNYVLICILIILINNNYTYKYAQACDNPMIFVTAPNSHRRTPINPADTHLAIK